MQVYREFHTRAFSNNNNNIIIIKLTVFAVLALLIVSVVAWLRVARECPVLLQMGKFLVCALVCVCAYVFRVCELYKYTC